MKNPIHIAFVTTCKGRLHQLEQTLPLLLREQPDQVIVVDYECSQQARNWVEVTCSNFEKLVALTRRSAVGGATIFISV